MNRTACGDAYFGCQFGIGFHKQQRMLLAEGVAEGEELGSNILRVLQSSPPQTLPANPGARGCIQPK